MSNSPQFPPPAYVGPATFVDESDALSPTWWNGPNGQRVRYAISVMFDDLADGAELAVKARFPSICPTDAYPWLAADRLIDVGPNITNARLIVELLRWLVRARFFGTNKGILLGILNYLSPNTPTVRIVNNDGWWYSYVGIDPWPVGQQFPSNVLIEHGGNWDWDSTSDPFIGTRGWWRSWLVVRSSGSNPWATPTKTWGSFNWGDGTAFNWTGTQNDKQALQNICAKYKGAHTYMPIIIVSYIGSNFTPVGSGGQVPDGNWGHWGKVAASGGYSLVYVSARNIASASYIDGVQ